MKREFICKIRVPVLSQTGTQIYFVGLPNVMPQHTARDIYDEINLFIVNDFRLKGYSIGVNDIEFLFISLVN